MFNLNRAPKLASDLGGITAVTYSDRADNNLTAAIGPPCNTVRKRIAQLGKRPVPNP